MRIGQQVRLEDPEGGQHSAIVTEIAGTGDSGMKRLDLAVDGETPTNVPHLSDRKAGEGFWTLEEESDSTTRAPVERRKKRE